MASKQKKDKTDQTTAGVSDRSSSKVQDLTKYFEDSRVELSKVSWATRKEVKTTSIAVLILVVVMAIFLGLADVMLSKLSEFILTLGS